MWNRTVVSVAKNKGANFSEWLPLWLFWPFGSLVMAFSNFRSPNAKWVVWLFFVFFGFVFIYADPYGYGGADSARYAANLIELHKNPFSFNNLFTLFYKEEGFVDIYQPLATWIVSLLTDNPRWLFTLFAAVFGYFYVQNMWMVFDKIDRTRNIDLFLFLFMLAFALVNPIWNINGVRMWTAAHVFIFGLLRFVLERDRNGIYWIFASILFHFSFFVPVIIFLIYLFVPKNNTVWIVLFFVSSFISELDLEMVRNTITFLPDFLQSRLLGYVGEAYVERIIEANESFAWHVNFANISGRYILYGWVLIVYFIGKNWLQRYPAINQLFVFGLFLGVIAQILSVLPSGGRYFTIVSLIFYAVFVLMVSERYFKHRLEVFRIITLPFIAFMIIFKIRMGFDYIGISTFLGNPIISAFYEDTEPLIDFVKGLL